MYEIFCKINCENIVLDYDESSHESLNFDDSDPDFLIFENDEVDGILVLKSDSDLNQNVEPLQINPSESLKSTSGFTEDLQLMRVIQIIELAILTMKIKNNSYLTLCRFTQ